MPDAKQGRRLVALADAVGQVLTDVGWRIASMGSGFGGHGYVREWGQEQTVR